MTATLERRDTTSRSATEPTPRAPRRGSERTRPVEVAVWVALCAVAAALLAGHSMWFDELQAWNIARASHSLGDLWSNLRLEGHPVLWYLPLYALTRVTGDPRSMQVFEWLVLCATYAAIVFRAPFPLLARVALAAGYFVTFEYGVITRGYGIGVLMTVLALTALRTDPRRPEPRYLAATLALVVLGWTSIAGAILAIVIAAALVWSAGRRVLVPALVAGGSAAVAVLTCRPPADFVSFSTGIPTHPLSFASFTPSRIAGALAGPWRGLVPIPLRTGGWNTNVFDGVGSVWLQAVLGVVLLLGVAYVLRGSALALRTWVTGSAAYLLFAVTVVLPDRSHYAGVFFLLFLSCAWLAWPSGAPSTPEGLRLRGAVFVVLAVGVLTMVSVALPLTSGAFAPDRALADAARAVHAGDVVVSAHDFHGVAMAGYLDAPVYSVARGEWIRFFPSDRHEQRGNSRMTDAVIRCGALRVADALHRRVVLVTDRDLDRFGWRTLVDAQGVRLYSVPPGTGTHDEATCAAS